MSIDADPLGETRLVAKIDGSQCRSGELALEIAQDRDDFVELESVVLFEHGDMAERLTSEVRLAPVLFAGHIDHDKARARRGA